MAEPRSTARVGPAAIGRVAFFRTRFPASTWCGRWPSGCVRRLSPAYLTAIEPSPEGQLGEAFSVSRTVIREAMRILAAQGLVEVSQGRAPRVRPVDSQTVVETFHTYLQREDHSLLDLIEVRRPLEAVIAALAAERAMPAQIQELEESVRQLSSARQASRQIDADLRFHELLAEATGNPIFPLLLKTLAGLMRCSRQKTLARSGVETTVAGHRAVLAAVQRRDPDAARQAMLDHLTEAERDLRGERE